MLRPLVRLLLRHGVSYREMAELSKKVYVEVATDEFGEDGQPTNVSRVALLTGMTRRDVRKARLGDDQDQMQVLSRMNTCARVLSGWFQDPAFRDTDGQPLRLQETGDSPSFAALARRYAPDVPISATLRELKRSAAVSVDEDGRLVAGSRNYMPQEYPGSPEALTRAGSVVEDLGNTLSWNLAQPSADTRYFERRATNIHVDEACTGEFEVFVKREGQAFLERVDAWLSEHETSGSTDTSRRAIRLGLGMYWIQDFKDPDSRSQS